MCTPASTTAYDGVTLDGRHGGGYCCWKVCVFFFSSRRRHTRCSRDWSSDVCSSDLGNDKMQRFSRAGGARNHVESSRASAAQIFMRQIEQALIVGIGMDRGHGAASDAESVLDDLRYGRKTIGGAGGIANYVVLCRIVALILYTKDKGGDGAVGGRGA